MAAAAIAAAAAAAATAEGERAVSQLGVGGGEKGRLVVSVVLVGKRRTMYRYRDRIVR